MTSAPAVYAAISAVQAALAKEGIGKHRRNQQQGFAFRGIDDVYAAIAHLLPSSGLAVMPRMVARQCEVRATSKGSLLYFVTVEAEFDFVSVIDGSRHTVRTFGEASDSGDKATNKAMSAAMKYAVLMTFTVPTEGDNDADAHTPPESRPVSPAVPPSIDVAAFCERWRGYLAQCVDRAALEKLWHETKAERAAVKAADAKASAAIVEAFKARTAELGGNHQTPISAG